ncbi:Carbonic anhydrase protein [Halorhabdus tiamatea SARL4B]|uniref:carbonic anhydrase n=1 Tax=Halorhabdus tiamatea SARL4B TaxID=1033806 RepID=F7PN12_9EURY|nr:carbonic anhydrase [Halorhabdus tiamatea]ERJ07719.1 Carbonic anhydrase protein [Halorhabdus tiamatea SARL4B]CCQ32622.1 carbonic anhydrase [Halorhabdus tiamatea SARL4B]
MRDVFVSMLAGNDDHARAFDDQFDAVQDGQRPDAVTVTCSDSRVLADHAWGNARPGHLFTVSNIGNRVIQHVDGEAVVSGDVLYPIEHTGTETAVIVGHTGCGAVTATYDALTDGLSEPPGIEYSVGLLVPHLRAGVEALPEELERERAIDHLVEYNVDRQVEFLQNSPDIPESVDVVGVVYDFQDRYDGRRGEVHVVNVDGETDPEVLKAEYPAISDRIERLWVY